MPEQEEDIRWIQRLYNFNRAFTSLEDAVARYFDRGLNQLEEHGLIQRFEETHELAWNVLRDYFRYQGNTAVNGSRDATREAFNKGLIEDGEIWMDMIKSRNLSSHTYNEHIAASLIRQIVEDYHPALKAVREKMQSFL